MPRKAKNKESSRVKKIKAVFSKEKVLAEKSSEATNLHNKNRYGEYVEDKVQYTLVETLYLIERGKLSLRDVRNKVIKKEDFLKKCNKLEKNFFVRYSVFKDLRNRGYVVKTALKFGADFRVYDKGVKPGEGHVFLMFDSGVEASGKQFWLQPNRYYDLDRCHAEVNDILTIDKVLLINDGKDLKLGKPYVKDAKVEIKVLEHRRGPKIIVYKMRPNQI